MGAFFALFLTAITSAGMAYAGYRFDLAHFHLIGGIPLGAVAIGAGAAIGTSMAVRIMATYDTAGERVIAQFGGLMAYLGAVALDFLARHPHAMLTPLPQQIVVTARYLEVLVQQGGAAFAKQLPGWVHMPTEVGFWIGGARLIIEVVGAVVATGWAVSLLTDVPFCWKNRRFYELRHLVESANVQAVREWEMAMNQRRPVEARAIFARVREGKVRRTDRAWMRIAVHQCSGCHTCRIRIERRRRAHGTVLTEPPEEFTLEAARGAALLAT